MEFESNSNQFEESIKKLENLLEKIQDHKSDEEHILQFFGGDIIDIDGQFIIIGHQQLANYKKEIQKIKYEIQKLSESLLKSKQTKSHSEEIQYLQIQVDTFQNQVQKLQKQVQSESEIRLKMEQNFKTIQTLQKDKQIIINQNNLLQAELQSLQKQNEILLDEKNSMEIYFINKQEPQETINQEEDLHSIQLQSLLIQQEQDHDMKLKSIQNFAEISLQDIKNNLRENKFEEEWFGEIFSNEKIYQIIKLTKERNNLQDRLACKMHDMIEERENFFKEKKELQNQIDQLKQFRENLSDSINHIDQIVDSNLSQVNDGIFNIEQYQIKIQNLQKQIEDMAQEISDSKIIQAQYQNQIIENQQKYDEVLKEQSKLMEQNNNNSVTEYQRLENQFNEQEKKNRKILSIQQQQKQEQTIQLKKFEDQLQILKEENDLLKNFQQEGSQNYLEQLKEHYRNKYKEQYEQNYIQNERLQEFRQQNEDLNVKFEQAIKNYQELKALKFENQITYDGVINLIQQLDELKIINNMLKKDKHMFQKIYESIQNSEQSFDEDAQSIEDEEHIISGVNEYCDKLKMYEQYTQLNNQDDVNKAVGISTRLLKNIKNNLN